MSDAGRQRRVVLFSTRRCGWCARAKQLLERRGVEFEEIMVDDDEARRRQMEALSGRRSVPQVFIGGHHVGGYDALRALDLSGELDGLLVTGTDTDAEA